MRHVGLSASAELLVLSTMLQWLNIQPPIFTQFFSKVAENSATRKDKY